MQRSATGIAIFSVQDIIVREPNGPYPIMEFVFFRTLFSIPVVPVTAFMTCTTCFLAVAIFPGEPVGARHR